MHSERKGVKIPKMTLKLIDNCLTRVREVIQANGGTHDSKRMNIW